MTDLLKKLMFIGAAPGNEGTLAAAVKEEISPYVDTVDTDALGNLIALKKGNAENPQKVMLAASLDETGLTVTYIEENGRIRAAKLGEFHYSASFSRVVSHRGVPGVLISEDAAPEKALAPDRFYIDIGAKNKKEAEKKVAVGDTFTLAPSFTRLGGKTLAGRPFDNRAGCAILIETAKHLSGNACDVYFVFAVQREVGHRGLKTAAFGVDPDIAIAVDVTDAPGVTPGKGPAIRVKSGSAVCHPDVNELLKAAAEDRKIPYQYAFSGIENREDSAGISTLQLNAGGVRASALSVPCRNLHTPNEMLKSDDLSAVAELLSAFLLRL